MYGEMEQPIPIWSRSRPRGSCWRRSACERSGLPSRSIDNGPRHTYVELADEAAVAGWRLTCGRLAGVGEVGVSCFARRHGDGCDKTRMFGPGLGVAEEPATGSAAGPLAVHLARHGWTRSVSRSRSAKASRSDGRRGCRPWWRALGDGSRRVAVGGGAVIVARGDYRL